MKRGILAVMAMALMVPAVAEAQAVFIARKAVQRIHRMTEEGTNGQAGYDFASVVLEAPADRVFAVALERARNNRAVRITMSDPGARRLQIAQGDRTATLNVVEMGDQLSQLLIAGRTSRAGEPAASSEVVAAVMRVCAELKKTCELAHRAPRNVFGRAAFAHVEGTMKDIVGLFLLAVLILAGLGFTNLMGTVLEQRAVLQAEAPR